MEAVAVFMEVFVEVFVEGIVEVLVEVFLEMLQGVDPRATQSNGSQAQATMKLRGRWLRWLRSGSTASGGNQMSSLAVEAWRLASSLTFSQSEFNGLATSTLKARVRMGGSRVALGLLSIGRSPQGVKSGIGINQKRLPAQLHTKLKTAHVPQATSRARQKAELPPARGPVDINVAALREMDRVLATGYGLVLQPPSSISAALQAKHLPTSDHCWELDGT